MKVDIRIDVKQEDGEEVSQAFGLETGKQIKLKFKRPTKVSSIAVVVLAAEVDNPALLDKGEGMVA